MSDCQHEVFNVQARVGRLTNENHLVTNYTMEVSVKCVNCGLPFNFKGVECGLNSSKPTMSPDGLELRAPIEPHDGTLKLPRDFPGYKIT